MRMENENEQELTGVSYSFPDTPISVKWKGSTAELPAILNITTKLAGIVAVYQQREGE